MANVDDKEIEIQVKVEEIAPLKDFLENKAKFIGETRQIDKYYTPVNRNFLSQKPVLEWLRLRDSSGKYSINYKRIHYEKDGRSHYKDEYEADIGELTQMENIFSSLDFKQIAVVDKKRRIYAYQNYEISIDSVKDLGDFVEIEFKGKTNKSPALVTNNMLSFLKKLGVGKIIRNYSGYPFQLLFPSEVATEEYN